MTTTDERPSSYHPVDPERGRSAKATERAAAEAADADRGGLRAQPRAGARARRSVAAAGDAVREKTAQRRNEVQSRGSGPAAAGESRGSVWEQQPPSLAELWRQAIAGPTRTVRLPDGKVAEETVDWPDWQITAWKAWQVLTLLLIGVPGHVLLWAEQKPSRLVAVLGVVGFAVFLGWYGVHVDPMAAGGELP